MKKIIISVVVTAAVLTSLSKNLNVYSSEGGFTYSIIRNEAVITGFTGKPVSIVLPEYIEGCPVTEIGDNAFCLCSSLKEIIFPETLKRIGHHGFYACSGLEMVSFPENLSELMDYSFCGCTSLKDVRIPENVEFLPDSCFRACTGIQSVKISDSVSYIGDYCFSGCTSLSYVSMGNGVEKIGDSAFYMCNSMWSMYIPPSVREIGENSIGYSPYLNHVYSRDDFNILSKRNTEAEKYAHENNLVFRACSGSADRNELENAVEKTRKRHRIPYYLSCIFAVISMIFLFGLRNIFKNSKI